jgi:tRNA threonylcarbamoyladenosine biosynthesis protein TsaE
MKILKSFSFKQTQKIAEDLAKKILKAKTNKNFAKIIALFGELGAGKTTFVSGFFKGLNIKKRSPSPTFILMRKNKIPNKNNYVYHIDAYRIKSHKEFEELGLKKIISNPQNILIIEWPEKIQKLLPKNIIKIYLKHTKKENERRIILKNISL